MNWGYKLLLVFVLFGGLMLYMVWRCIQTPVDLVSREYYSDELAYQDVINSTKNANSLSSKVRVDEEQGQIVVSLPAEMKNKKVSGTIFFYCPSDAKKDKKIRLEPDAEARQQINSASLHQGAYIVKLEWEAGTSHYYVEEPFNIR